MAIDKGNIKTSANYDVKAQKPLDGRAVRPTKADLINRDSWSADGSTVYAYEGMQVYVQDEKKTYYLKDLSKMFATDFSGWELMGTGAAAEVEVDTELSETSENAIANSTVSRALAKKQDLLMNGINIKTINGQNVLGRGNIEIEGGSGGITEEKEVYIGSDEPTDENVKLWIDTDEEEEGGGGASVEVIDNLESDSTTAALSANQGRVLKEMIAAGGGNAGGGVEGARLYVVPQGVLNRKLETEPPYTLTEEEKADFLAQGDFSNTIVMADVTLETGYHMRIPMRFGYVSGIVVATGENCVYTSSSVQIEKIDLTRWELMVGDVYGTGEIGGATSTSSGTINLT